MMMIEKLSKINNLFKTKKKIVTFRHLPIEECKCILNGMNKQYKVIKWEIVPYYTRETNSRKFEEMKIFFYDMIVEYKGV